MTQYPAELRYTREHEWAKLEGDKVRVGITAYAIEQLGDVTLIDLPSAGTDLQSHERFGDIESVKTVSELFAPVSGEVLELNGELESSPELLNEVPYEGGWILVVRPSDINEFNGLMDATQYENYLGSLEH